MYRHNSRRFCRRGKICSPFGIRLDCCAYFVKFIPRSAFCVSTVNRVNRVTIYSLYYSTISKSSLFEHTVSVLESHFLSIQYPFSKILLFVLNKNSVPAGVCHGVCVCVRERERVRERARAFGFDLHCCCLSRKSGYQNILEFFAITFHTIDCVFLRVDFSVDILVPLRFLTLDKVCLY